MVHIKFIPNTLRTENNAKELIAEFKIANLTV